MQRRGAPASLAHYASAMTDPAPSTSIGSAAVCAATSATFVGLGGAFLIGVLLIVHPALLVWHDAAAPIDPEGAESLKTLLHAASAACFIVAGIALVLGLRKLP
jgi:hypothetical protein